MDVRFRDRGGAFERAFEPPAKPPRFQE